jgi:hypothetical protein
VTVTKHEILTVTSAADRDSLIAALGEVPADAEFMDAEKETLANGFGHAYRKTVLMTFRRDSVDE